VVDALSQKSRLPSTLGKPLWSFSINIFGSGSTRSPSILGSERKSGPPCRNDFKTARKRQNQKKGECDKHRLIDNALLFYGKSQFKKSGA
jgi:hypothetical protein